MQPMKNHRNMLALKLIDLQLLSMYRIMDHRIAIAVIQNSVHQKVCSIYSHVLALHSSFQRHTFTWVIS